MNKHWPQQGVFIARVREYCKKNGLLTPRGAVKLDVVADLFNLNEDTLVQFLHDSNRKRPHIDTLTTIASVLGCAVVEFFDAPSQPAPGLSTKEWAELSEAERTLVVAVLAEVTSDSLSLAEKEELLKGLRETKERVLRLRK